MSLGPYSLAAMQSCWDQLRLDRRTGQVRELAAGADGVRRVHFEARLEQHLREIHRQVHQHSQDELPRYQFGPLLQVEKSKGNGLFRKVYVPRIRDQLLFRRMHDLLRVAAESKGIRLTPPAPVQMVRRLRRDLRENPQCKYVLQTDLSTFYDSVPRHRLYKPLATLGLDPLTDGLLRRWMAEIRCRPTRATTRHRDFLHPGLPQGVSLASPLSELWVQNLDRMMDDLDEVFLYRYVDDLLVLASSQESLNEAFHRLREAIEERGLSIAQAKTRFTELDHGFSWLGLIHRANSVTIPPKKLYLWRKRLSRLRRKTGRAIAETPGASEKLALAQAFLQTMHEEASPRHNFRIGWFAYVDQLEPWKDLDRFMHNMIASAFRQAGSRLPEETELPSIYRSIYHRRQKLLSLSSHRR